jgi:hypothetical protein
VKSPPAGKTPLFCRPLSCDVTPLLASNPHLSFPCSAADIKGYTSAAMTTEWNTSRRVDSAAKLLKPSPDLPLYFTVDRKPLLAVRARLRLGVALVPKVKRRYDKSVHKTCVHCRWPVGTVRHVLMMCPLFLDDRASLIIALLALDPPVALNLDVLLGRPPREIAALPSKLAKQVHTECLRLTGEFLIRTDKTLHL